MNIDQTPVVTAVYVTATVRDFSGREKPMVVVTGIDVADDIRTVQMDEKVALDLAIKLLTFVRQVQ